MDATAPRIGVFFCDCGETIDGLLDFGKLRAFAKALDDVAYVEEDRFMCSPQSSKRITEMVKEHQLDRLIIAACSPRLYLDQFREAAKEAGVNPYMVEQTNLREQVAWIHSKDAISATQKAQDMLSMSVARSRKMRPSDLVPGAVVREDLCSGCGVCASTCRQGAISFKETGPNRRIAQVDRKECKACGACVAACPAGAMNLEGFSNEELVAEIDAFSKGLLESKEPFPAILVFACNWCSYPAADLAGLKRLQMNASFRLIRTPCSARVDPEWVLRALSRGVDGVLILGGKEGSCHYQGGNVRTKNRMALLTRVLEQLGFDTERFLVDWVNQDEPQRFVTVVDDFTKKITELGPNPMRAPEEADVMTSALRHGRDEVVHPAYNWKE
jgi:coenzyme F420-reducing hydrogenase delta subunit/ferredoxin